MQTAVVFLMLALVTFWAIEGIKIIPVGSGAEILLFQLHFKSVGPGWVWAPFPLRVYDPLFPTFQLPLEHWVPVVTKEAEMAQFYTRDGVQHGLWSLGEKEQVAALADPLNRRLDIRVKFIVLFQFVRPYYGFLTEVKTFERLGENLGNGVNKVGQELLSSVTASTSLEQREVLSRIFNERFAAYVDPRWGVNIVRAFVGEIEISQATTDALRKRLSMSQEWRGRADGVGYFQAYMETDSGKRAASHIITYEIHQGAAKTVIAPGLAGTLDSLEEIAKKF